MARRRLCVAAAFALSVSCGAAPALGACHDELTDEGRLVAALDARSFRLDDGRIIRLAGLELPAEQAAVPAGTTLRWRPLGKPDRYGRIVAIVAIANAHATLQEDVLAAGAAVVGAEVADSVCLAGFRAAEDAARSAKRGLWSRPSATKNAESLGHSPGDVAALVGQFGIFEGKVLSVRERGSIIYVNFGTRSARALTVTVMRDMRRTVEAGGLVLASLQGRRVRVRGWVEDRGGLRIEASRPEQIETMD